MRAEQVSGRALIPPLSLDELELDADVRPLPSSVCGPADDCLNAGDFLRVCHGPVSVAASNASVVTFADPWPYNSGTAPWTVVPTGVMSPSQVAVVEADLAACPAGVACSAGDAVASVPVLLRRPVEAAPLCVAFESLPYRLLHHLNVSVRTLGAATVNSGSSNVVISGVSKRLYFSGDGLTVRDSVRFVVMPPDVDADADVGTPSVAHPVCGASAAVLDSAGLANEVDKDFRVAGATRDGRTFVDVYFNASVAGSQLVVCYTFHDAAAPVASPKAL